MRALRIPESLLVILLCKWSHRCYFSLAAATALHRFAGPMHFGFAALAALWRAVRVIPKPQMIPLDAVVQEYYLQSSPTATQADNGSAQSS